MDAIVVEASGSLGAAAEVGTATVGTDAVVTVFARTALAVIETATAGVSVTELAKRTVVISETLDALVGVDLAELVSRAAVVGATSGEASMDVVAVVSEAALSIR